MKKPVVNCTLMLPAEYLAVGGSALVIPKDHPNHKACHQITNGRAVRTSSIVRLSLDQRRFETKNTIYEFDPVTQAGSPVRLPER